MKKEAIDYLFNEAVKYLGKYPATRQKIKDHLQNSVPYFRYLMMGLGLLLVMRYRPKGLLPEKIIKN